MPDIVLVTGATGIQGGATARATGGRVAGACVGGEAQASSRAGANLVRGDMSDRAALDAAVSGVHGVFSVQPTAGCPGTPPGFTVDDELRLGRTVAETAAAAGAAHFVYASVGAAEADHGIRRWQSKAELERYATRLGLPTTALCPVHFMENRLDSRFGLRDGVLTDVIRPEVQVQLIAGADIGAFAALAFARPGEYLGATVELAGDELTMTEIAAARRRHLGRPIEYRAIPREALSGRDPDVLAGYRFANQGGGWHADIAARRHAYPRLLDFDTWLEREATQQPERPPAAPRAE